MSSKLGPFLDNKNIVLAMLCIAAVLAALIVLRFKGPAAMSRAPTIGNTAPSDRLVGSFRLRGGDETNLKAHSLDAEELDTLKEAEIKLFEAERDVVAGRYVMTFFQDFQKSKNLGSMAEAQQSYFSENANVSDADVSSFIKDNMSRKEISEKSELERQKLVRQFLETERRGKLLVKLVDDAISSEDIKIARVVPAETRFSVAASTSPSRGDVDSKAIEIIVFSDYQCPFCATFAATVKEILATPGEKVRFVHKDLPLINLHPLAMKAAEAARCADEQKKFWEMHDALYASQKTLSAAKFVELSEQLGLDQTAFANCIASGRQQAAILADVKQAEQFDLTGTPTIFINGLRFRGILDVEGLHRVIDRERDKAKR